MKRKKLLPLLYLILLIAAAIWVRGRWSAWFAMPDEEAYVPLDVPHRVLLTFGDSSELSRNVSWQCDTLVRPSYLELRMGSAPIRSVTATGEVFASRAGRAAYYVCRLRNLVPDTLYSYRVCTDGQFSSWYSFRTYSPSHARYSFIYVGDVQDTIGGRANEFLRQAFARHADAEFLVCGGDLTERPADKHWAETFRDLDSIGQTRPVLCVPGNHEYLKTFPVKLERRYALVFSYFIESMVGENHVYSFRYGNAEFFLLDSNREPNYLWTQRRWLKQRLAQSQARWKILVLHHPLFSIKGKMNNLMQRWLFNDLVEDYGVDLVLQGHEHAYARMTAHAADGQALAPVYTVSHCSPKCYRITFDDRFDRYGISSRYYQTVQLSPDTLTLTAYEVGTAAMYDSLQIVKQTDLRPAIVIDHAAHLPENMQFEPSPGSKKDRDYAERIRRYIEAHPEKNFVTDLLPK